MHESTQRVLGGRYRLLELLGGGATTAVYRAVRLSDGTQVAIKLLEASSGRHPVAAARFAREREAARTLVHPCIVETLDAGEEQDGTCYLVMELLRGRSLRELLDAEAPLDPARTVRIAIRITNALVEAHGHDLLHRDLKPDNVFVCEGDRIKLFDFGLVRATHGRERRITQLGINVGTARYMAPEQLSGGKVDERSDLYALGVVLYECLAGEHPIPAGSLMDFFRTVQQGPQQPLSRRADSLHVPMALAELVDQLLARDPADRPQSAAAVLATLVTLQGF